MRKNNKGFAISTVIYGLSIMGILIVAIMMATMSNNRANTRNLAKSIEDELNRVSKTEVSFAYMIENDDDEANIPEAQPFTVPEGQSGFYRIELWGTQGGGSFDASGNHIGGGKGAYTSGIIYLTEGQVIYFYVGRHQASGSGRATEVRLTSGRYQEESSYVTTIMAAAGGGNDTTAAGGTLYGYNQTMMPLGGSVNVFGSSRDYKLKSAASDSITNGTLIGFPKAYAKSGIVATNVKDSNGAYARAVSPMGTNQGGDGYYPSDTSTTGGASYISGYAGVNSFKTDGTRQTRKADKGSYINQQYVIDPATGVGSYTTGSPVYFVDGRMYPGVNEGDGKAKIERLSTGNNYNKLKRNPVLKNQVRYVRDCISAASASNVVGVKIAVMSAGKDFGAYKSYSAASNWENHGKTVSRVCAEVDLGSLTNVDEIAVWHIASGTVPAADNAVIPPVNLYGGVNKPDIQNHTIEAGATQSSYQVVKGYISGSDISETETVDGIRVSAYQAASADLDSTIITGDYYIMPVNAYGQVITAPKTNATITDPLNIEPLMGYKRQKWSISLITNKDISPNGSGKEYKITEEARFKAMTINNEENIEYNLIRADRSFNNYRRDTAQIWKIIPAGDGTYFIRTSAPTPLHAESGSYTDTGNIICQTNNAEANYKGQFFIGRNQASTERFRLISVDYLSGS